MKILPVEEIRKADEYTILHEPIADIDLMERAASACSKWLRENIPTDRKLKVFCGNGNNGGDGFAIARMMIDTGYVTEAFLVGDPENLSPSCRINYKRLQKIAKCPLTLLKEGTSFPAVDEKKDVLIDALFGSGLTREAGGFHASVIAHMNRSQAFTISIDIPSGLFCDTANPISKDPPIVHADHTLTFAPPKLAFFFPQNESFVGNWHLLDIGIMQEFIDGVETKNFLTEPSILRSILRKRNKFDHKGTFGHLLLICGSYGKMGAAVLAARAALRSGPGLVTAHIPATGNFILQSAVPEAMLDMDPDEKIFSEVPDLTPFSAIATGPGIGKVQQTQKALKLLIQNTKLPLIFDADAINILGENRTWLAFLPKDSILTPHMKEFERLAGKSSDDFDRNQRQREFSVKYNIFIILKGAYTAITTPDGKCYFNPTGNPGMATGGSGDVLTGIIGGLKAQGYSSFESCLLGVYLHGLAGDLAAADLGQESLIAGDIVEYLGKSFLSLYG